MLATKKKSRKAGFALWDRYSLVVLFYVLALLFIGSLTGCSEQAATPESPACQTKATVKDLRGLDGCSYVLVLESGEKLEPLLDAGQPSPTIKGIVLRDGMHVTLSYQERNDYGSICMVGKIVEVTCFSQSDTN
jgi:hypothetical protein